MDANRTPCGLVNTFFARILSQHALEIHLCAGSQRGDACSRFLHVKPKTHQTDRRHDILLTNNRPQEATRFKSAIAADIPGWCSSDAWSCSPGPPRLRSALRYKVIEFATDDKAAAIATC